MMVYFSSCMFSWGRFLVGSLTIHLTTGRGPLADVAVNLEGSAATGKKDDTAWVCVEGSPFDWYYYYLGDLR